MRKIIPGAVVVCLILSVSWSQGEDQPKHDILIVDVAHAVESCKEQSDLVAAVRKEAAAQQKRYSGRGNELQETQKSLMKQKLSLRDEQWYADVKKALEEEGHLKAVEANIKIRLADRVARGMEKLLISAKMAANKIMRARGAKIVLVSKMSTIKLDTEADFKDELVNRRVLAAIGGVDITTAVIAEMDLQYKARKKAPIRPEKNKPGK